MRPTLPESTSRRTLLGLAPAAAVATWAMLRASSNARQMEVDGDCAREPAADLLYNFVTTNFAALPYVGLDDRVDWRLGQSTKFGAFMAPPDWSVVNAWANEWGPNGIPRWQTEPLPAPAWTTTTVIAPDQDALWMYVEGSVDDIYLTPELAGELARATIVGSDANLRDVCALRQTDIVNTELENTLFMTADRQGSELLLTHGWALLAPFGGPSLGKGSAFGITGMIAPRRHAEDVMRDVFLRIMWQLLPRAGGGSDDDEPTPTPTPEGNHHPGDQGDQHHYSGWRGEARPRCRALGHDFGVSGGE